MDRKQKLKERAKRWKGRPFPLTVVTNKRSCGDCQACCFAVGVHELEKPIFTTCTHQCEKGCGIYEERPESCKTYWCCWLEGIVKDESLRPDKIGIILDFRDNIRCFSAWELWEGAADSIKARRFLVDVSRRMVVILRRFNDTKRTLMGPDKLVLEMMEKLNANTPSNAGHV